MGNKWFLDEPGKTKKIIEAVKLRKGDRAITYHSLASTYNWTIDEIDQAPWDTLSEMLVVLETQNKNPPKVPKVKGK